MANGKIKEAIEDKWNAVKTSVDIRLWQAREWGKEHPEEAATIICTAIGAIGLIGRRAYHRHKVHMESQLKERYIYDRSLGRYWKLRRKLTTSEQIQISEMKRAGMSYGDILTKLKLL